jgi:hypothetical protein
MRRDKKDFEAAAPGRRLAGRGDVRSLASSPVIPTSKAAR